MAGHFMAGAVKHPGAFKADLRRMGLLKPGEKVTVAKAEAAKRRGGPVVRKRATLAETFLKSNHGR